jgi:uncharacterized damage-inducible protein DinB
MNTSEVIRLYAFNRWANLRFFASAEALNPEQYAAQLVSSFPSIRDTMAHIVAVEWVWLQRWQGVNPTGAPEWARQPALTDLRAQLDTVEGAIDRFLAAMPAGGSSRTVTYRRLSGDEQSNVLGDLLLHVVNHGTYHRGQLTTLFRQVGAAPPATDFTVFAAGALPGR